MSSNLPRSFAVVIRCCLIFLIAISTNANALTQCGFNPHWVLTPNFFLISRMVTTETSTTVRQLHWLRLSRPSLAPAEFMPHRL